MKKWLYTTFTKGNSYEGADYSRYIVLFEGLQREESAAIRNLYKRMESHAYKMGHHHGLSGEDIEELIGDCVALVLLKIRTGQYVFQGYDPVTFAIEIAKNKVRHFKTKPTVSLGEAADQTTEPDLASREDAILLERLLLQLPDNCQKLIRLKYLEGIKDKDTIELKLTQYTTVDALKNQRARCMKKLTALGAIIRKQESP